MVIKYCDFAKEYPTINDFPSKEKFRSIIEDMLKNYDQVEIDVTDVKKEFTPSFLNEVFNPILRELGEEDFFQRVRLYSRTNNQLEYRFRDYSRLNIKLEERNKNVLEKVVW